MPTPNVVASSFYKYKIALVALTCLCNLPLQCTFASMLHQLAGTVSSLWLLNAIPTKWVYVLSQVVHLWSSCQIA